MRAWLSILAPSCLLGCGTPVAETSPEEDMAALDALARDHREAVQALTDTARIGALEERYHDDWHALADPCVPEIDDACPPAATGEYAAPDWLAAASEEVDAHTAAHAQHATFQDSWLAEDDHADAIDKLLDQLVAAYGECAAEP